LSPKDCCEYRWGHLDNYLPLLEVKVTRNKTKPSRPDEPLWRAGDPGKAVLIRPVGFTWGVAVQ
jgi:hypothetical protein